MKEQYKKAYSAVRQLAGIPHDMYEYIAEIEGVSIQAVAAADMSYHMLHCTVDRLELPVQWRLLKDEIPF